MIKKFITFSNFVFASSVLIALVIGIQRFFLLFTPGTFQLTSFEIVLLSILFTLNIAKLINDLLSHNQIIYGLNLGVLLIVAAAIVISFESGYPQIRSVERAGTETFDLKTDIKEAIKIKKQVINEELSPEEAKQILDKKITTNEGRIVFDEFSENDDEEKIINSKSKTIPLKFKEWSCNEFGCAYTDNILVWTISSNSKSLGALAAFFSLVTFAYIIKSYSERNGGNS